MGPGNRHKSTRLSVYNSVLCARSEAFLRVLAHTSHLEHGTLVHDIRYRVVSRKKFNKMVVVTNVLDLLKRRYQERADKLP